MLMILARLVRSESFWAVAKVRSPHTGPGIRYIIDMGSPSLALGHLCCGLCERHCSATCRHTVRPWV